MAADAGVVRGDIVEPRRIDDGGPRGIGHMIAASAMTAFAADVPFRHGFRLDVIIYRMASVAEWAGRPLHVVGRIKRRPPIGVCRNVIVEPTMMGDVPLCLERKIIFAPAGKVALFP